MFLDILDTDMYFWDDDPMLKIEEYQIAKLTSEEGEVQLCRSWMPAKNVKSEVIIIIIKITIIIMILVVVVIIQRISL